MWNCGLLTTCKKLVSLLSTQFTLFIDIVFGSKSVSLHTYKHY